MNVMIHMIIYDQMEIYSNTYLEKEKMQMNDCCGKMKKEFVYGHPMKYEHFTYDENSNSIFFSVIKSTNDSQRCLSGSCNIEKMQCTCGFPEEYKSLCCHMIKALVIIKKIEISNLIPSYYKCNYSFEYSKINFHFPKVI